MSGGWERRARAELGTIADAGRLRGLRTFDAHGPRGSVEGRSVVSFASNDYLGLAGHPAVVDAAAAAVERWGVGATASRLVVGTRPVHAEFEEAYAAHVGVDRALAMASGYAANLAVMTTFGGRGVTVLSDEWNHASIIDGCRLSRADVQVYRHADVDHLAALLAEVDGPSVVVTDTVFSMDGDLAPVETIAACCARHDSLLVVDEAHAVLGPEIPADVDGLDVVRVGTMSKALGSLGGVVAASAPLIDLVVNRARSFIFSTGLSIPDVAAALAALRIVESAEGAARRATVLDHVRLLRSGHATPIVPLAVGPEADAVAASQALLDEGFLVPAIRPPTVPPGTSRLRIAVSAAHEIAEVAALRASLERLGSVS